jgi:hypothetical protein
MADDNAPRNLIEAPEPSATLEEWLDWEAELTRFDLPQALRDLAKANVDRLTSERLAQLEDETRDPRGRAYHEAGHAIAARALRLHVESIEIWPTGHGKTLIRSNNALAVVDRIAILVAGERAEIMFGAMTPDAAKSEDRKQVTALLNGVDAALQASLRLEARECADKWLAANADTAHRIAAALVEHGRIAGRDLLLLLRPDLFELVDILADWIAPAPNIPAIYLFGSRVRGDHRPDSDVDVRLFLNEWKSIDVLDMEWWAKENETDFAALKQRLPGPLAIHRETSDEADTAIVEGRKAPLLSLRRVICVWTPTNKERERRA